MPAGSTFGAASGTSRKSQTSSRVPIAIRSPSDREPHRLVEVAEVGVERALGLAQADELAGLVGADQQRAADLAQHLREGAGVDAAQRRLAGVLRPARGEGNRDPAAGRARELVGAGEEGLEPLALVGGELRVALPGPGRSSGRRAAASSPPFQSSSQNSETRFSSSAGCSRRAVCSATPQRSGGSRWRSARRVRVIRSHCSATISGRSRSFSSRQPGTSGRDHGGPLQPGRSG